MKNLLTRYLLAAALFLTAGSALAHPGHLTYESVHGFLHAEHIVILSVIGLVIYIVKILSDK
jgi:hypothetical protein